MVPCTKEVAPVIMVLSGMLGLSAFVMAIRDNVKNWVNLLRYYRK